VILVDTSVWVQHLRALDRTLARLLDLGLVLTHPFIVGELALGNWRNRDVILSSLRALPQGRTAGSDELLHFIGRNELYGSGIGYVDAHLLASARLTAGAKLWTRDKRLEAIADRLELRWLHKTPQ
jgi:predicted nucleic acid-binding protein